MGVIQFAKRRRRKSASGGGGDTTPPEITNLSAASNTISFDISEPGTTWMLRNTASTLITGAAAKAGAEASWVVEEGANVEAIDDSGWADGTYYLHFAGEDAAGNLPAFASVVEWIKTTPFTVYSHVLNPTTATSALRYSITANTIFNLATSKSAGYWFGAYAYFDGTNWSGTVMGLANSASDTGYFTLETNRATWRQEGGATVNTTAFSNPGTSGWYFLTAYLVLKEAADPGTRTQIDYWRNGTKATGYTSTTAQPNGFIAINRIGLGYLPRLTPTSYIQLETCGYCWGTGNPQLMHDWVYNSGILRDVRDYNFAGDANACTLNGFWPAGRAGAATFDVNDAALDDSIDVIDTPTMIGTMQWAALDAPIGA